MFLSHSYIPTHLLILISNSTGKPIASKFLFLGSIISFKKITSKLRFCSLAQGFHYQFPTDKCLAMFHF
jgi:hypothetical protein